MSFKDFCIKYQDPINIIRGYFGCALLAIDAKNGWVITNKILKLIETGGLPS